MKLKIIILIIMFFTLSIIFIEISQNRKHIKIEKIKYEEVNLSKKAFLKTVEPITKIGSDYWDTQKAIDTTLKEMITNE